MLGNRKVITVDGRNGAKISFSPEAVVSAMPDDKTIGQTVVVVAIGSAQGQFFINMPHSRFAQIWEAALNGRDGTLQ